MRFSETWLREFANPEMTTDRLVHQLTMAGLEVDAVESAAGDFTGVVVGRIVSAEPHPEADRLQVCRVEVGGEEPLQIVCGAPNARPGLLVPVALEGARLPGDFKIRKSKLRGVHSYGMLCSAKELGVEEEASGLLELPYDAPVGTDIRDYLQLDDQLIELDLTPNRADCLSVEGIAREVALLNELELVPVVPATVKISHTDTLPIQVDAPADCPRYLGRLIKGVSREAVTPLWMSERLRRSGVRSLDPVVDITNYVLLELGQPLHAFDAHKLEGGVRVRRAVAGEKLRLLNDQEITLDGETLVIADHRRPLALAGIMGGSESAVGDTTRDIFLECAFFTPERIMGKARRYGLSTDSSHRFERGVSFQLQERAIERASELILAIAGGEAGPVVECGHPEHLPKREPIQLRARSIRRLLGLELETDRVTAMLRRLGLSPEQSGEGWRVTPPGFRFDLAIEADLIEELGRVHGYDQLPRRHPIIPASMRPVSETRLTLERVKDLLVDRGYQEAITYSFVAGDLQKQIEPDIEPLPLKNPLSAELGVMRTTLWPGLLEAALKNRHRQQTRVRLFETGLRFIPVDAALEQRKTIAWLVLGDLHEEQWGEPSRAADFFDLKADVEALIQLTGRASEASWTTLSHPALHPGQSAEIRLGDQRLGRMGLLHPALEKALGFEQRVYLVELEQDCLLGRNLPAFAPVSKYPQVRRDLALIVDESLPVADLIRTARLAGGALLRDLRVFDLYRGPGVTAGKKSVAIALFWQDEGETLVDSRVDEVQTQVMELLAREFGARLRD